MRRSEIQREFTPSAKAITGTINAFGGAGVLPIGTTGVVSVTETGTVAVVCPVVVLVTITVPVVVPRGRAVVLAVTRTVVPCAGTVTVGGFTVRCDLSVLRLTVPFSPFLLA